MRRRRKLQRWSLGQASGCSVPSVPPFLLDSCKSFLEPNYTGGVAEWSFLTNHARALLCIADDPGVRLRDIANALGITERSAYAIVADLTAAGYVAKEKEGRRNRYEIQTHLPLPESTSREHTLGEVLDLLVRAVS